MGAKLDYGWVIPADSEPFRFMSYRPVRDISNYLGSKRSGVSWLGAGLIMSAHPDSVGKENRMASNLLTMHRGEQSAVFGTAVVTGFRNRQPDLMTTAQHDHWLELLFLVGFALDGDDEELQQLRLVI